MKGRVDMLMAAASFRSTLMVLVFSISSCGDDGAPMGTTTTATTFLPMATTTTAGECSSAGYLGCPCTEEGKCLEGLKCSPSIGICIDPSDLTTGSESEGSSSGGSCIPGAVSCPCDEGFCDAGLNCINGYCWEPSDPTDTGDTCVDDYDYCTWQEDCCNDNSVCVDRVYCAPFCEAHTDCPSHCCSESIYGLGTNCTATPCSFLCIDTCTWSGDGECDDGGPGAVTDSCPYGTDCSDCGLRDPF